MNEDLYGLQASGIDPEIAAKMIPLQRQRMIASALLKQSMEPINVPQGTKISPFQGLAKIVQAYMAQKDLADSDKQSQDLTRQNEELSKSAMKTYEAMRMGTPEIANIPLGGPGENNPETSSIPARGGDPRAAVAMAMSNPLLAKNALVAADLAGLRNEDKPYVLGRSLVDKTGKVLATDETWAQEQEAARLARMDQAKAAAEERAARDAAALQGRKDLVAFAYSLRSDRGNKPPSGFRFTKDGNLEAIPGGPADTKLQGALNMDTAQLQSGESGLDRLALETNKLLNHPGLKGITGIRGAIPNIPGTDAADANALLNTIKSQVAFGVLQDMRNNSKTGGALGNVSDAEGKRLEANLASLEKAQSLEQMKQSLEQIIGFTGEAKGRLRGAFNMKHKGQDIMPSGATGGKTVVERRTTASGKKLVKYSDGTIGEE